MELPLEKTSNVAADGSNDVGLEIGLVQLLAACLRRPRLLLLTPLVLAGLVTIGALITTRDYQAESSFLPQTTETPTSGVSTIAAQFGISLPTAGAGESLDFYVELLRSPVLLHQLILSEYDLPVDGGGRRLRGSLLQVGLFDLDNAETRADSLRIATTELENSIEVSADHESGLVRLRTLATWPALAVEMNRRLVDLVSEFNLDRRQSRAAAELTFVEGRLEEAAQDLEEAEAELQRFLESNRTYQTSPQLSFDASRLERRVALRQDVYGMLSQAAEQARIERVRNTPVITIVDPPGSIVEPAGATLKIRILLALVLGLVLGFALALIAEFIERLNAERPGQLEELRRAFRTGSSRVVPGFLRRRPTD